MSSRTRARTLLLDQLLDSLATVSVVDGLLTFSAAAAETRSHDSFRLLQTFHDGEAKPR